MRPLCASKLPIMKCVISMGAQNAGCGEAIFEYSVSRALFRKRMGNGRSTNGNQCARRKKGAIMFDPGSTGFMILGAMLVFLMTPALAFFYGGLSRRKNVLNTMFMSIAVIGFVGVLWIVAGWSFAYGGDGSCPFFGGFDQIFCVGLLDNMLGGSDLALSHDTYPVLVDVSFQAAFAIITIAIITGSLAGRMKFGAVLAFISIWLLLVYAPPWPIWCGVATVRSSATPLAHSTSLAATLCISLLALRASSCACCSASVAATA